MRKNLLFICLLTFTLPSCEDYLNVVPKNQKVVSNADDLKAELLSYWSSHNYMTFPLTTYGYNSMSLPLYNDVTTQLALYSDEIDMLHFKDHENVTEKCMKYYYQDINWKGTDVAKSIWNNSYCTIGLMNSIIDDLKRVNPTIAQKEVIGGEAKVLRDWCTLKLLQFFSPLDDNKLGIPLNFDSENVIPSARMSQADVYESIENELLEVASYTTASEDWNFFYTPVFISSVLAEFYSYRACSIARKDYDWENAAKYAHKVCEDYVLENSSSVLTDLFKASASGTLISQPYYALRMASRRDSYIGNQFTSIWGTNNGQSVASDLWQLYSEDDIRKKAWFNETEVSGRKMVYVAKPQYTLWGPVSNIQVLYRKAELYLLEVEALCHLGQEEKACLLLNRFRKSRCPLSSFPDSYADLLEEVYKERRKELCFENGIRWLDMKRLGLGCLRIGLSNKSDSGTEIYKLDTDDYRFAMPIPQDSELDYNASLEQNPGWVDFE